MPELTYDQLAEKLTRLFERGDYARSLALANEYLSEFPEHLAYLNYVRICSAARLGDLEFANMILRHMLEKGIWYSEELLIGSPSLAEIQNNPDFQHLLQQSVNLKEQSFGAQQSLMVLHDINKCQFNSSVETPCPVLVALHSNGEYPQETLSGWKSAAQEGWFVVAPKSPKTLWSGSGHYWINHHEASNQIYNQLSTLRGSYNIDTDRLVIGGFSMGAEIALWMAIQGMLDAKGFILLAPDGKYFNNPIRWRSLIEDAQESDLRGTIITSQEMGDRYNGRIITITALLNEYGINTKLIFIKQITQHYPTEFADQLRESLKYISA